MSALGQKRTCAVQQGMSAIVPIADVVSGIRVNKKPPSFRPRASRPHTKLIRRLASASCQTQRAKAGGEDSRGLGEARLRHFASKCVRAFFPSLAAAAALSKKTGERSIGTALHAQ